MSPIIHQSKRQTFKPILILLVTLFISVSCVETIYEDAVLNGEGAAGDSLRFEPPPISEAGGFNGYDQSGEEIVTTSGESTAGEPTAGEPTAGEPTAGEPTAGQPTAGEPMVVSNFPDYAVEMLEYVNAFRQTGGSCGGPALPSVAPLSLNLLLTQAAISHAEDMGQNNYFSHDSQDGRTPWDRINATGYVGTAMGENIAAGRGDAQSAFEQWKSSAGHCANMLNPDFTELGVGYAHASGSMYRHYWVQTFARPR